MATSELPPIDVRHLRYFLAVADELSFTRAADRLYVGQPALSIAVRQLEAAVGVQLLVRSSRQVQLTPAGNAFRQSAELALAALERSVRRAREAGRPALSARLCMPYEGNDTGRMVLRALRERRPEMAIERRHLGSRPALRALMAGEVDALVGGAFGLPVGVAAQPVRRERLVVVLPEGHALVERPAVRLAELAGHALYLPSPRAGSTWNTFVRDTLHRAGVEAQVLEGGDGGGPVVFTDLVAEGRCLAIAVESDELGRGVVGRPIDDSAASYPWSLMWLDEDPGPAVEALREAAREARERHGWSTRSASGH